MNGRCGIKHKCYNSFMPAKRIQVPYMANRPSEHKLRASAIRLSRRHPLGTISIAELCRESGLSRRAFYNQYSSMSDFYAHCKRDFEREIEHFFIGLLNNGFSIKVDIVKILVFVRKYQVLFKSTLENDDFSLLTILIQNIKPLVMDEWKEALEMSGLSYRKRMRHYRAFAFRLAEKMDVWIRWQSCAQDEMAEIQNDILRLIDDYRAQLETKKL